eukprot:412550-Amorphochlora_amoeboformis.AAC.2
MFRVDTVDAVDTLDAPCKYTMQRSSSSYKKGTHCDVFDIDAKRWRTAQVLAKRRRQVLISYHGWDSKYDQWIDLPRIGQLWSKVKRGEYTGNSSSPLKAKIIAELDAVEVKSPYVEVTSERPICVQAKERLNDQFASGGISQGEELQSS